jgi:hypothetical protein
VSGAGGGGGSAAGGNGVAAGCDVDVARQALQALGIATVGDISTFEMPLPATLTDAQWSVKSEACRQGGYDLSAVAGMTVCMVSAVVSGTCQGNPTRVWVLMSNGTVDCIYRALCPGSRIAPGVYSAVDPLCQP